MKMLRSLTSVLACLILVGQQSALHAEEQLKIVKPDTIDDKLPNELLVGDSICSGYNQQVRTLLDNLTSLPTNDDSDSLTPRKPGQTRFWTAGRKPFQGGWTDWGRLIPVVYGTAILNCPAAVLCVSGQRPFQLARSRTGRIFPRPRSRSSRDVPGSTSFCRSKTSTCPLGSLTPSAAGLSAATKGTW